MTTSTTTPAGYDVAALQADAAELAAQFQNASPFAHIVIDGLLRLNPEDMASFPDPDWPHWHSLGDRYQLQKQACDDISVIPEPFAGVIRQLSEPRFLKALEEITGIAKLIPDPYLTGGGLHASGSGGILAPHTDFHHYRGLNLYRRVNVLVYLNDNNITAAFVVERRDEAQNRPIGIVHIHDLLRFGLN